MDESNFTARMALIRTRFAAKLVSKLKEAEAALPELACDEGAAADRVATVYRQFHDVCGIGPTVGFTEAGRVARTLVDSVLVGPFRGKRGLTTGELAQFKKGLDAFRCAAQADMRSAENNLT